MRQRVWVLVLAVSALLATSLGVLAPTHAPGPASGYAAAAPVASVLPRAAVHRLGASTANGACRAGLIALTFDDGPSRTVTPTLVHTLVKHRVAATFFMVGSRIRTAPAAGRLVQRNGFTIGNHTWSHADLPRLSDAAIRQELRSTRREMRVHGIVPSDLMRPPYGDITKRVRRDIRGLGLVPVLWTIDSRDWAGGSPGQIASRILRALHRHGTNIVLQHDGVTNSPNSVAAVPALVRQARARGYCFTRLGPHGRPLVPGTAGPPSAAGGSATVARFAGREPVTADQPARGRRR